MNNEGLAGNRKAFFTGSDYHSFKNGKLGKIWNERTLLSYCQNENIMLNFN